MLHRLLLLGCERLNQGGIPGPGGGMSRTVQLYYTSQIDLVKDTYKRQLGPIHTRGKALFLCNKDVTFA